MSQPQPAAKPLTVAILAFDRISPFHLAVPCVVFAEKQAGLPPIDCKVCSFEPGNLQSSAGLSLYTHLGLAALTEADIIIIPSWRDPQEVPPPALLTSLRTAQARGAQLVGLCLGAYVLAEAGVLDGKKATTHWAYAEDFAQRYPRVELDPQVLYVDAGGVVTSAGTAAGLDCCLYLLRQRYGAEVANNVARRLVVSPHRQGGQAQFIAQPIPVSAGESRLSEILDWVRQNLALPHNLDSLAAKALMSRRTFTRHFRQLTGMTFGNWLLNERLALAQRLLEATPQSIDVIATHTGFGSSESLRLHFRRQFGLSPNRWRQTFQG